MEQRGNRDQMVVATKVVSLLVLKLSDSSYYVVVLMQLQAQRITFAVSHQSRLRRQQR